MKMKISKIFKIAIVTLFTSTSVMADDTSALKGVIAMYGKALNASDTDQVMKLYSEEPTFMPQHSPAQVGREAVRKAYDNVFAAIKLNVEFTTHAVEVMGDIAWVRTSTYGKTTILANNAIITEGNNELFIFRKEKGDWKIYQYLFATNQPRQ
jgi:uncharacterized protein (TIGR02246 family)